MTHLREEMYDAYASMHVDLERLATQAQVEGGRLRRRSRRRAAGSTLVLLAVVGMGAWASSSVVGRVSTVSEGAPAGATAAGVRLTGVAALSAALARVAPTGVVSHPSGMSYEPNRDGSPNALAKVSFAPSAGAEPGDVGVIYRPAQSGDAELYARCHDDLAGCETSMLSDGSVVLTYAVRGSGFPRGQGSSTGMAVHRVVNGVVVAVAAHAPRDADSGPDGKGAVLTRDQLVDLVSQPEWSWLLPIPHSD